MAEVHLLRCNERIAVVEHGTKLLAYAVGAVIEVEAVAVVVVVKIEKRVVIVVGKEIEIEGNVEQERHAAIVERERVRDVDLTLRADDPLIALQRDRRAIG